MNRTILVSIVVLAFVVGCSNKKPEPPKIADEPSMMAPKDEKGNVKADGAPKFNATP